MDTTELNSQLFDTQPLIDKLALPLTILTWVSVILTLVITVFIVLGFIRRWKVQTAVLEMRDSLREIKDLQSPPSQPPQERPKNIHEPANTQEQ